MSELIIAIDGPAGSGKSTVARAVAATLGWSFLDTGAMYRSICVEAARQNVSIRNEEAISALAERSIIRVGSRVLINDVDVTEAIRTDQVNHDVSLVATYPSVRSAMVDRQREFADGASVGTVVEGRDIATVVFPNATLKIFLTASLEERGRRRGTEGIESIQRRDEIDQNRETSPLRRPVDARLIDTTNRSVEEIVKEVVSCLESLPLK